MPLQHLVCFIANCYNKGCAASTIATYVAGLSFHQKIRGGSDPLDSFLIKKLLQGCKRTRRSIDSRAPVTSELLEKILNAVQSICYSDYETVMFKAAFALAFYGLMRISELVYTNGQSNALTLCDVKIEQKALLVTIQSSKSNSKPVTLQPYTKSLPQSCPEALIKNYLDMRPAKPGVLLVHMNELGLTRYQFSSVLNKIVAFLGLPTANFKTHSFRIGRATQLAIQGVSDESMKLMGRWRSEAYKGYVRINSSKLVLI